MGKWLKKKYHPKRNDEKYLSFPLVKEHTLNRKEKDDAIRTRYSTLI